MIWPVTKELSTESETNHHKKDTLIINLAVAMLGQGSLIVDVVLVVFPYFSMQER